MPGTLYSIRNAGYLYRFAFRPQGCPCGYYTDPRKECHCTPRQIQQYLSKISGPLLDRVDIQLEVPALNHRDLRDPSRGESSEAIQYRSLDRNLWA